MIVARGRPPSDDDQLEALFLDLKISVAEEKQRNATVSHTIHDPRRLALEAVTRYTDSEIDQGLYVCLHNHHPEGRERTCFNNGDLERLERLSKSKRAPRESGARARIQELVMADEARKPIADLRKRAIDRARSSMRLSAFQLARFKTY
ncbi:hypothetical protein [Bradyrhizobium elkanii]|uniref:hypothetical protein n=1 Tax=Bradyrhizobium elkanii TaxID=29448 RepID=UPI00114CBCE3|nr:hypothetical protein [Bradyrhizobium elkanii]